MIPSDIKFSCPYCQQHLEAPQDMSGEAIECPKCKLRIIVPTGASNVSKQSAQRIPLPVPPATPTVQPTRGLEQQSLNQHSKNNHEAIQDQQTISSAGIVCLIIGWICVLSYLLVLFGGTHHGRILRSLGDGNIGYALGSILGGSFFVIIALIMGIIIRRHIAGKVLLGVSGFLLLITICVN